LPERKVHYKMNYNHILQLCENANWKTAEDELRQYFIKNSDDENGYNFAAHLALRQGKTQVARWFINKITSKTKQINIEDICLDFFEANFESAYRKLNSIKLESTPKNHPINIIAECVFCIFDDNKISDKYLKLYSQNVALNNWNGVEKVLFYLQKNDRLNAAIYARLTELFFPTQANSFAALGLFNLYSGFLQNADRNFHEAIYRETTYKNLVQIQQFYLFCTQHRFLEAIEVGKILEANNSLDIKGKIFWLDASRRLNFDISNRMQILDNHFKNTAQNNPYFDVLKLRLNKPANIENELKKFVDDKNCHPAWLYFYAELITENDLGNAKNYAARAIEIEPLHPDAKQWIEEKNLNFEYAGIFIPKADDGGAWPNETQEELLKIIFLTDENDDTNNIAPRWNNFAKANSIFHLEAGSARLLPFVYKKLCQHQNIAEIDILRGIWKKSYFENALRMKYIAELINQLKNIGVEVVLMKGMANVLSIYDDIGMRPMSDIDILISDKDIIKTFDYLCATGWKCNENLTEDKIRFFYSLTFRHESGNIVDLHWRPCENLATDYYTEADFNDFQTVKFGGEDFKILAPSINLLCIILHGVEWNHLSPIRWICDALLLLEKHKIDWQRVFNLAEKYNCLHILNCGLEYLINFKPSLQQKIPSLKECKNDILINSRLRAKNLPSSFEEAFELINHYKKRFTLKDNEYAFICGGSDINDVSKKCAENNIFWVDEIEFNKMAAAAKVTNDDFVFIVVNAYLSNTFHTVTKIKSCSDNITQA
jgi:hypothetical protein